MAEGDRTAKFPAFAKAAGKAGDGSFVRESYDAAALILLAMQKAGDPAKALQILKDGGDVDYVGGSDVEMIATGKSAGSYREFENKGGAFETVRMLKAD